MNTVIIGGTGMLEEASLTLASRCDQLTMVAGTLRSLARFQRRCKHERLKILQLDWNDEDQFMSALAEHRMQAGAPDLVVAWLHRTSQDCKVAESLCGPLKKTIFVQICGSMTPRKKSNLDEGFARARPNVDYRRVFLGYMETSGSRRWLTHDEICKGTLALIDGPNRDCVVGQLED